MLIQVSALLAPTLTSDIAGVVRQPSFPSSRSTMARVNCGTAACLAALLVAVCVLAVSPAAVGAEETHSAITYNPVDMFLSMMRDTQTAARENTEATPSRVFLPMLFPPPVPPQPQNVYHKHVHHLPKKTPDHKPHGHHGSHPHYPPYFPPRPRYY
ncbi:hypothetical protein NCLIV_066940 [Neospora caninum Liverpool]|uniref:Uncharacterized protein n=1 Tax=Neospora caninum (strain Liverpool) TaxID=572307 RepID=F0VRC1_NEOCL|nr:hypothetical protein NCLIV_066940 [Neospora caninum Liverpool]CBZ56269.1 hypothetical protein NCLIV_066940 [Neospora caninum Liverpool]CEL71032.1 TPA: hypothetical protein BN1204_066940 [Neospora caninum Liverpool]|eukprot:XP_003886294.1 hypothetical protein NCLIV_066940 [Neospora caninum Liverpool]